MIFHGFSQRSRLFFTQVGLLFCDSSLALSRSRVFKKALPFVLWIKLILKTASNNKKSIKKLLRSENDSNAHQRDFNKMGLVHFAAAAACEGSKQAKGETENTTNHSMHDIPCCCRTERRRNTIAQCAELPYIRHRSQRNINQIQTILWNIEKRRMAKWRKLCVLRRSALRGEPIARHSLLCFFPSFTHCTNTAIAPSEKHFRFRLAMISITACMSNINTIALSELWWW